MVKNRWLELTPFIYHRTHLEADEQGLRLDRLSQRLAYCFWRPLDGLVQLEQAGARWQAPAGDAVLTEPGAVVTLSPHARVNLVVFDLRNRPKLPGREKWRMPGAWIDPEQPPQPPWRDLFGVDVPPLIHEDWRASACEIIETCGDLYWRDRLRHGEACARLYLWLLQYVRFLTEGEEPRKGMGLCKRVETLIEARLRNGIRVEDLARALGLSRAHLTTLYARQRGHGPGEAIELAQVERAKRLLDQTPASIAEISRMVGFRSPSAFTRSFQRKTGLTPSRYRERSRG
jgi:AraC-like DNA-binding protein